MANHPNRSRSTGRSYVIMLPKVDRLWNHRQASGAAIFSRIADARRTLAALSGRGALEGAKVMRVADRFEAGARLGPEGYWLI